MVIVMLCEGLGIGLQYHRLSEEEDSTSEHSTSLLRRFVTVTLAVAIAQASEFIHIPTQLPMLLIYLLVAAKIGIVIFLIVVAGFLTGANNHGSTKHQ